MNLDRLHVHNIDLHYHAGQERHEGATLEEYLIHARLTGRRVLGLTDHLGMFWPPRKIRPGLPYEQSIDGLRRYREEMEEAQTHFSEMKLLFGPEISPWMDLEEIPADVITLSDYFICEYAPVWDDVQKNTESLVNRMRETRDFVDAAGVPTFIAHPFRWAVNHRFIKRDIELWVTAIEPQPDFTFEVEALNHFFFLDLEVVGTACRETGIPLDINGATERRVRSTNLPATLQMLWAAWTFLRDAGADFVPGSDQHGYQANIGRFGWEVPWQCFDYLELTASDITFLEDLI